jgi:hypothetical protein
MPDKAADSDASTSLLVRLQQAPADHAVIGDDGQGLDSSLRPCLGKEDSTLATSFLDVADFSKVQSHHASLTPATSEGSPTQDSTGIRRAIRSR